MRVHFFLVAVLVMCGCQKRAEIKEHQEVPNQAEGVPPPTSTERNGRVVVAQVRDEPTYVTVRNVILTNSSPIHLKARWLRGRMYATDHNVTPSFDVPTSFRVAIDEAILGLSLADLSLFLKSETFRDSNLKNPKVTTQNGKLVITGTLKRVVPLPVKLVGSLGIAPDRHHVRLHADKISILKIPFKGLLSTLHVQLKDLVSFSDHKGIELNGDNVDIDVNELIPPPRAEGELAGVKILKNGDLVEYYGHPREKRLGPKEWRNYMRMRGGTLSFGKLTMRNADLVMIDSSQSDWLNFDLQHYQDQLVNGTTRITPDAGLQIFIPDIYKLPPSARSHAVTREWLKSRTADPPPDLERP